MRMNEKISSGISYVWAWFCGLFAWIPGISPDWWTVIIAGIGMLVTAAINWYWQRRRFKEDYSNESSK